MITACGWRMVYHIAGIFGAVVAIVTIIIVREPKRTKDDTKAVKDEDKHVDGKTDQVAIKKSTVIEAKKKKTIGN